jgi:uncharacterized protein YraI
MISTWQIWNSVLINRRARATAGLAGTCITLALAATASAITAGIHIHGTAPENVVNIRPQPNTTQPAIGSIPEGASPDYNCFSYGQVIGGVPIWFSVNYSGVTGYYASYYDDSTYRSDTELTGKYGIPKCRAETPPPAATPLPAPAAPIPTPAAPPTPAPVPTEATQSLAVDPYIWCKQSGEHQFDTEVRDGGVKLFFAGIVGAAHQNNWRCRWTWTRGGRTVWVPRYRYANIDFNQACQQQFAGSHLHYTAQNPSWPWECLGVAGQYYPPPSLSLRTLLRDGGYRATSIRSRTPGSLALRMSVPAGGANAASVSRPHTITIGRGVRRVTSEGSYAVRVRLTHRGRTYLRHRKHSRVTFTVRVRPRDGKVQVSSTTVLIRR